ncbi:MAG: hypothetical protein HOQ21_14725, partial [Dermatophilaceae bacterium]|nr:hypothetical protein [Dermatophilaceae bacterium]
MVPASLQKSTIVRFIGRRSLGIFGAALPGVAARAAEGLWFRLPPVVPAPLTHSVPTVRELLGAPFEVDLRGRVVRGWSWGSGPVVYLVHGWGGDLEQM